MDFGRESQNPEQAERLIYDYREADLAEADRALCDFAVKLSRNPHGMAEADIDALRDRGLSDKQISHATQVISYFNYINRIADGLGIDPEDDMQPAREEWLKRKAQLE